MDNLPQGRVILPQNHVHSSELASTMPGRYSFARIEDVGQSHKAFIAIIVRLYSKATHLKVVSDYTTDAFLATLRRFTSRIQLRSDIYFDCARELCTTVGANFNGADQQIRELLRASSSTAAVSRMLSSQKESEIHRKQFCFRLRG